MGMPTFSIYLNYNFNSGNSKLLKIFKIDNYAPLAVRAWNAQLSAKFVILFAQSMKQASEPQAMANANFHKRVSERLLVQVDI